MDQAIAAAVQIAAQRGSFAQRRIALTLQLDAICADLENAGQVRQTALSVFNAAALAPRGVVSDDLRLREQLAALAGPGGPSPANITALIKAGVVSAERIMLTSGPEKKQAVSDVLTDLIDAAVDSSSTPLTAADGVALKGVVGETIDLIVRLCKGQDPDLGAFIRNPTSRRSILACLNFCNRQPPTPDPASPAAALSSETPGAVPTQ